jgi:hypothetical protein
MTDGLANMDSASVTQRAQRLTGMAAHVGRRWLPCLTPLVHCRERDQP